MLRIAITSLLLLLATPALAQHTVLVLGVGDGVPATLGTAALEEALLQGIAGQHEVIDRRDLDLAAALNLLGCSTLDRACLRASGEDIGVDAVLAPSIEGGGTTALRVRFASHAPEFVPFDVQMPLDRPLAPQVLRQRLAAWLEGHATLEVRSSRSGDAVALDDRSLGPTPTADRVLPPGRYALTVTRDTRLAQRELAVSGSAHIVERFEDNDFGGVPIPPRRIAALSFAGGAILAGTGAAVSGAALARTRDRFDDTRIEREADDLARTGRRQATTANILLATAGACAITATVLWLVPARQERPDRRARLEPVLAPGHVGLQLGIAR
ncbi:MAG: PEGA domain-containing protein [Deltaproteobacteria bacterium]|nr:MAG: PEGA domain-containing protein [Deltaproteobacteria bacterium]